MNYEDDTQEQQISAKEYRGTYPFPDHYLTIGELYGWMENLTAQYPDICSMEKYGTSWEGRDLWMMKISDNVTVDEDEPEVLIDANIHAREWSTHQVASYFIWRILDEYNSSDYIHWLVNNREIFVAPMVNPDGYYFDGNGDSSQQDMWRKNRNDSTPTSSIGIDLNRNYDFCWNGTGASDDPSSDIYCGEMPFSEYETRDLSDWILSRDIDSYMNIHSYAGTFLLPGSGNGEPVPHDDWHHDMGKDMTYFTTIMGDPAQQYSYGSSMEEIGYTASGGAHDWTYNATGAASWCLELETGEDGSGDPYEFYPPESEIMTINQDVDDALIYQCRIGDMDLGDGTNNLFPPAPYIVNGTVTDGGVPVEGVTVAIENKDTGESISIDTDVNGYYELNFGTLTQLGYEDSHSFKVMAGGTEQNFTIGDEPGQRIDLTYSSPLKNSISLSSGWNFLSTRYIPKHTSLVDILDDPTDGIAGNYDKVMKYSTGWKEIERVIWQDGFESDTGWTFSGGEWERGAPQGLGGSGADGAPDPSTAYNGTNVLGYDLTSNGDYAEGMSTTYWAESPAIDLTGQQNVTMKFDRWLGVERSYYDHAYIEVYDGSSWNQLWQNPDSTFLGGQWHQKVYDVSTWADDNPNFQIRFGMGPTSETSWMGGHGEEYCGWNIDDLQLTYKEMEKDSGKYSWKTYVPGRDSHYNTIGNWDRSEGIWIHMTTGDTLDIEGFRPTKTRIILTPGWNMVGISSSSSGNLNLPTDVDKIGYYDSGDIYNLAYDYNPSAFSFTPGDAYWIHNPTEKCLVWNIDY
ncbi:MAG: M14 family zinc carboxypeptidase [Thermoplasmata archaeon]